MPAEDVMNKWASGTLHSGSKSGPVVKSRNQAIAIKISEEKKAKAGKREYQSAGVHQLGQGARFKS